MIVKKLCIISNVSLILLISVCAKAQTKLEDRLDTLLNHTVPLVSQDELAKMLSKKKVILFDTRTKKEYNVSHIKGARLVDYDTFSSEMVAGFDKEKPVVVYCSVGYRSEKIGEKLLELGFTNVQNLYGGIFEWKNHSHMVVDDRNTPTDSVHVYNADWGQYLNKGIKINE